MAPSKLNLALLGVLLSLQMTCGRIISFHAPTSLPSHKDFRIVIPDGSSPSYAALAARSEPAPVQEDQNDIPPPPRPLPQVRPQAPQAPQMVNPPSYAANAAAAFGIIPPASGILPNTAPVTEAPRDPNLPTAAPGVVQIVNSVIPNGARRIVEPPPAIVPPPDAVTYVPLREQHQQLLAQGYQLDQYAAPGAAFRPPSARPSIPSLPQQPSYASNFATFSNGAAIPAEGSPLAPATATPLVAAAPLNPLARQTSVFGNAAELSIPASANLQFTHHPGHGEAGGTSYSSSSFTNRVQ
ncbi:uncharacterized protein LOC132200072 [Neocloeon triangulifer]|uniref:uncharacterized protein LOC132200072 n=1 Tax=Neocloeon triangulifer TaxID=2078957 RepID=UPI00286F4D81|nr:uncharacterized protein LOC132200072 [Neocloeon triangulifer]